jgi:hypothetical protein
MPAREDRKKIILSIVIAIFYQKNAPYPLLLPGISHLAKWPL